MLAVLDGRERHGVTDGKTPPPAEPDEVLKASFTLQ